MIDLEIKVKTKKTSLNKLLSNFIHKMFYSAKVKMQKRIQQDVC